MNKLRLTIEEKELFIRAVKDKLELDHKGSITGFSYTQKDVKEFLESLNKSEEIKKPTIYIDVTAYTKMYELVKQSPIELQWHMLVSRNLDTNSYNIYDILMFPQTNSGTSTTTDQDEFAKWQTELIKDPDFPLQDLRGHGHSHVNMNVYSSGIDDAYQENLITNVKDGDFYLFLVLNKKMEMFALLYDFNQQIVFETKDMDIQITDNGEDIKQWCKDQIKKYCKSATAPRYKTGYTGYSYCNGLPFLKEDESEKITDIKESKRTFGKRRNKK